MTTLYELLGAFPSDGAEELRAAFRKAVKSTHPDICPGDPDAAIKFRQILRANDILADGEQRAAYDHLLALARDEQLQEQRQATRRVIALKLHRFASAMMAFAGISAITVGGVLLIMNLSVVSKAPAMATTVVATVQPATLSASNIAPIVIAPLKPIAAATDAIKADPLPQIILYGSTEQQPIAKAEDRPIDASRANCLLANTEPACPADLTATIPSPPATDAKFYHDRGMQAYRNGDLLAAAVELDHAIKLDPKFAGAYISRSIVFYRMRKFDRAFADIAKARELEIAGRAALDAKRLQLRPTKAELPRVIRLSQQQSVLD